MGISLCQVQCETGGFNLGDGQCSEECPLSKQNKRSVCPPSTNNPPPPAENKCMHACRVNTHTHSKQSPIKIIIKTSYDILSSTEMHVTQKSSKAATIQFNKLWTLHILKHKTDILRRPLTIIHSSALLFWFLKNIWRSKLNIGDTRKPKKTMFSVYDSDATRLHVHYFIILIV